MSYENRNQLIEEWARRNHVHPSEVWQGTAADKTAISNPQIGKWYYETDTNLFWYYDGTNWKRHVKISGDTMTGQLAVADSADENSLVVTPTGNAGNSQSTGGAVRITNTSNIGSALVVYTNHATGSSNLVQLGADNTGYTGAILRLWTDGSGKSLTANSNHATTTSETVSLGATSPNASTVGITGAPTAKGVLKITHSGAASDASSAGLSIDLAGSGTAAQGIFIDATNGGTTGSLIKIKNNTIEVFTLSSDGALTIDPSAGTVALAAKENIVLTAGKKLILDGA